MLPGPERTAFDVSCNILLNVRNRGGIDGLLYDLVAARLRSLAQSENHPLAALRVIYRLHPSSHYMYGAKNDITNLIVGTKSLKRRLNVIHFDAALVDEMYLGANNPQISVQYLTLFLWSPRPRY